MIMDALATFSTSQNSTVSVASTDVVDTRAAGDAYKGAWFCVQVNTAFTTASTVPTFTFQLQTSDNNFAGGSVDVSLCTSSAFLASQLTAGKIWAQRIGLGAKRYLRGYKVVSTNTGANYVTAAVYSMFIVADINKSIGTARYLL